MKRAKAIPAVLFRLHTCDHRIAIRVTRPVVGHSAAWRLADRLVPPKGRGILCMRCGCTRHIVGYWGTVTRRQERQEADGGVFVFERGVTAR